MDPAQTALGYAVITLGGMAALIKTLLLKRLDKVDESIELLRNEVRRIDRHDNDIRALTKDVDTVSHKLDDLGERVTHIERITIPEYSKRLGQVESRLIKGDPDVF